MARLMDIVIDCAHAPALARWWVQVLEDYSIAPYGPDDPDPDEDPTVLVLPGPGGGPRIWFTQVPEPKTVKNRVHLDVNAEDPVAELARLTALGARFQWETDGLTVLADPEGNEFCLDKDPAGQRRQ
jgi:hypothetical protein